MNMLQDSVIKDSTRGLLLAIQSYMVITRSRQLVFPGSTPRYRKTDINIELVVIVR